MTSRVRRRRPPVPPAWASGGVGSGGSAVAGQRHDDGGFPSGTTGRRAPGPRVRRRPTSRVAHGRRLARGRTSSTSWSPDARAIPRGPATRPRDRVRPPSRQAPSTSHGRSCPPGSRTHRRGVRGAEHVRGHQQVELTSSPGDARCPGPTAVATGSRPRQRGARVLRDPRGDRRHRVRVGQRRRRCRGSGFDVYDEDLRKMIRDATVLLPGSPTPLRSGADCSVVITPSRRSPKSGESSRSTDRRGRRRRRHPRPGTCLERPATRKVGSPQRACTRQPEGGRPPGKRRDLRERAAVVAARVSVSDVQEN